MRLVLLLSTVLLATAPGLSPALAREYDSAVARANLIGTIKPPGFDRTELTAVETAQAQADTARKEDAAADARQTLVRFLNGMDVGVDKRKTKAVRHLFRDATAALEDGLEPVKERYDRKRPFAENVAISTCPGRKPKSSSFPSSHAATGTLFADLIAAAVPEKKDALQARGVAYGESRVICGFHYPSDVKAGQDAGHRAAAALLADSDFRKRLDKATPILRAMLGS